MRKIAYPIVAAAGFAMSPVVAAQTEEPANTEQAEPAAEPAAEPTAEPASEPAAEPAAEPASEEPATDPSR